MSYPQRLILNNAPCPLAPCTGCGNAIFHLESSLCDICRFVQESRQALALSETARWIKSDDVDHASRLHSMRIGEAFNTSTGSRVERKTASRWRIRLKGDRFWSRMLNIDEAAQCL